MEEHLSKAVTTLKDMKKRLEALETENKRQHKDDDRDLPSDSDDNCLHEKHETNEKR